MNTALLSFLAGSWFICSTNFPMWTKGSKTQPTFNYTLMQKNGKAVLFDEVKYIKNGKSRSIKGYDRPDAGKDNAFIWKGKGLLSVARSKWSVALVDKDGKWAVIRFSKTVFTPAGLDIIARDSTLSKATLENIKQRLLMNPELKEQISSLKNLYQP